MRICDATVSGRYLFPNKKISAEGINILRRISIAVDLHDGPEVFQFPSYLLDLPPYVCARHGTEGHKDLGVSRLEDFRDLLRLEKRIDRIGDTSGFGTEQRDKRLWQERKQEAHDVGPLRADAGERNGVEPSL